MKPNGIEMKLPHIGYVRDEAYGGATASKRREGACERQPRQSNESAEQVVAD
jgi:hypothetical protein